MQYVALNTTFGGTILFGPMNTFLYCILGSKVDNLQTALNWLSEHARVTLPTVPENILMLSDESMAEMAAPIAAAAVGSSSGGDDDQGVVGGLIEHLESALIVERNFYAIILGVWFGLALIGLLVVLWHSGGSDRYHSWRGTTPDDRDGDDDRRGGGGGRQWPWSKEEHPIYDNYAEKEFRGISPTGDIPQIIEPDSARSGRGRTQTRTSTSFFDHSNGSDTPRIRPFVPRKSTFGSMTSLVAPGQAFLKMTGRSQTQTQEDNDRLVAPGLTSEKYSHETSNLPYGQREREDGMETPPPFWVNRFYGGLKSFFPTRGQRHGAALERNDSQRTDPSFGASRQPSAITPQGDWGLGNEDGRYPAPSLAPRPEHNQDPFDDPSRMYPPHPAAQPIYPRPLSRAPTLSEGMKISRSVPASEPAPPLPSQYHNQSQNQSTKKHDSVDYLESEVDSESGSINPYDDAYEAPSAHQGRHRFPLDSPASSSYEYFAAGPIMGSAQKVDVQRGASSALAEIISRKQVDLAGTGGRYL